MGLFVRKVKTGSGAIAVQIVHKHRGQRTIVEHLGSAHDEVELAALVTAAKAKIAAGQLAFDFGAAQPAATTLAVVDGSCSRVLWEVLAGAYRQLGFHVVGDPVFEQLVLARVVEPTSKADTIRVLSEIGVANVPSLRTVWRTLRRCVDADWRGQVADAAYQYATKPSPLKLVLYDCTTLYFEVENEDELRKVGMSKERRVDPQILVGLLVDASGFPLEVHAFDGRKAETKTLLPVLDAFRARHQVTDVVVVADAGMLSAANLNALEDAGLSFIVASRTSSAPYDLAAHFARHGTAVGDGDTVETARLMGQGRAARQRRVVWHYSFKRKKRDNMTLNKQIERAEQVAAGTRPVKKDRFVALSGDKPGVDWTLVERARSTLGYKGYVTNLDTAALDGPNVVAAYHDLFQVERSFRMAKSDLRARPVFHHTRDSIEAHLTIVFTALAVARHLQAVTGTSIRRIVRELRPLRDVTVTIAGHSVIAVTPPSPAAAAILDALGNSKTGH